MGRKGWTTRPSPPGVWPRRCCAAQACRQRTTPRPRWTARPPAGGFPAPQRPQEVSEPAPVRQCCRPEAHGCARGCCSRPTVSQTVRRGLTSKPPHAAHQEYRAQGGRDTRSKSGGFQLRRHPHLQRILWGHIPAAVCSGANRLLRPGQGQGQPWRRDWHPAELSRQRAPRGETGAVMRLAEALLLQATLGCGMVRHGCNVLWRLAAR